VPEVVHANLPELRLYDFRIDRELDQGLKAVKAREGIAEGEQIRRALRAWLEEKGVITPVSRPAPPLPKASFSDDVTRRTVSGRNDVTAVYRTGATHQAYARRSRAEHHADADLAESRAAHQGASDGANRGSRTRRGVGTDTLGGVPLQVLDDAKVM
jgi:hypothetical protein